MRLSRLLPVLALCCLAMGQRSLPVTVRFYTEANQRDSSSFSTPIKLGNPPRDAFLQKVPTIHERHVQAIYPYRAADGTWGCAFKLDNSGRLALEVVSTEKRGKFFIGFIGTKKGQHRVQDMIIDRTVSDGIISVAHGLTDLEIAGLSRQYKILGGGEAPKAKKQSGGWWPFGQKKQPGT